MGRLNHPRFITGKRRRSDVRRIDVSLDTHHPAARELVIEANLAAAKDAMSFAAETITHAEHTAPCRDGPAGSEVGGVTSRSCTNSPLLDLCWVCDRSYDRRINPPSQTVMMPSPRTTKRRNKRFSNLRIRNRTAIHLRVESLADRISDYKDHGIPACGTSRTLGGVRFSVAIGGITDIRLKRAKWRD